MNMVLKIGPMNVLPIGPKTGPNSGLVEKIFFKLLDIESILGKFIEENSAYRSASTLICLMPQISRPQL
jgi:hypothetical protein